jgi:hypothetical protein
MPLPVGDLAFYDVERSTWVVEPGVFEVRVGASASDIRLVERLHVVGVADPGVKAPIEQGGL